MTLGRVNFLEVLVKTSDVESRGLGGRDLDEVGFPSRQGLTPIFTYFNLPHL